MEENNIKIFCTFCFLNSFGSQAAQRINIVKVKKRHERGKTVKQRMSCFYYDDLPVKKAVTYLKEK